MHRATRIVPILLILLLCAPVMAGPVLPAEYYGTVTINDAPAPAGTIITALIDGQVVGTLTTTTEGAYGGSGTFDPRLAVQGISTGQEIQFRINGYTADQTSTFSSGSTQQFVLSAQYSTESTTVATPAPAVPATTTAADPAAPPAPEETLLNPWTPEPTASTAIVVVTGSPRIQRTTESQPEASGEPREISTGTPEEGIPGMEAEETPSSLPVTELPQTATPASPGYSFETMMLLGLLITTCGAVLRR